jgi:hypothetical protein
MSAKQIKIIPEESEFYPLTPEEADLQNCITAMQNLIDYHKEQVKQYQNQLWILRKECTCRVVIEQNWEERQHWTVGQHIHDICKICGSERRFSW